MPVLSLNVNRQTSVPLYRQVYESLRSGILSGRLAPGLKIPGSRETAAELGVSRNTVTNAYELLASEGYLKMKTGSGTYVSAEIPDDFLKIKKFEFSREKNRGERRISKRTRSMFENRFRSGLTGQTFYLSRPLVPFAPCVPSIADFPFEIWAKIISRRLKRPTRNLFQHCEPAGYFPLRRAIASYLGASRGVTCAPEQIIIVSGTQQAMDLTARVLLDERESVWLEDPSYPGTRGAIATSGAKIIPVPVDNEGLNVEQGKILMAQPRLICVTPSNQYPLGVTMSLKRRLELLEFAEKNGSWIIEDDYDSEFRYTGRPVAALQGLDRDERVIYAGTFSKILSPALRIGYLIVPNDLVETFTRVKTLLDRHSPILEQIAMADFFNEGHFARHIRRMRQIYLERRRCLISALEKELNGLIKVKENEAGLHLIGWLDKDIKDNELAQLAAEAGVVCEPLSALSFSYPLDPGLVLGFACFDEMQIIDGVKKLRRVIETCIKGKT